MNAVILIAVLSVANSCMYGSSRLLASLAAQGQAPRALAYIDRKGRPLVALGVAALFGLLAFLYITPFQGQAFTWMLALSGLSAIFTWGCICYSHIRFRAAWLHQGNRLDSLIYQSPIGSIGSWIGLIALALVLVAQFWVAISPVGIDTSKLSTSKKVSNFFEAYLALPVVAVFYVGYKWLYRTKFMRVDDIDLVTGRNEVRLPKVVDFEGLGPDGRRVPRWKKIYKMLC
jgi:amino acid transporter